MVYKYKGTKNIPLLQLLKQLSYIELTLWKMRGLRCLQQHNLPIDDASLAADGDISQWCLLLNEQWKSLGFQNVFIDTDSDEYWVAIVPIVNN
ncbi:hypothetical protein CTI18_04735 [Prevotella intermedia]|uniref:DUF6630 domain-containing protein n=1 Tax=Prevotella intermedia TaxID=28131 RepID=A0A2G8IB63_PREIN|nr:hypothetical protein CTI18_04735 [Prevotella intermedia]